MHALYTAEIKTKRMGNGMCPQVLPTKITHGIFSSLFFPSVNALLAVGMNIHSPEEGTEGSGGLPLTLVRDVVVTNKNFCISSHEITWDALAPRAAKGQCAVNRGAFTVCKEVSGVSGVRPLCWRTHATKDCLLSELQLLSASS